MKQDMAITKRDMTGKVVVITGATSGIGQVAAENLAGMGARIVQVARDRARGGEARQERRLAVAIASPDRGDAARGGDLRIGRPQGAGFRRVHASLTKAGGGGEPAESVITS